MGFCIESSGMTQGGQGEAHADFEPPLKDDVESMEDGQDPEVTNSPVLPDCDIFGLFAIHKNHSFTYLISDVNSLDQ